MTNVAESRRLAFKGVRVYTGRSGYSAAGYEHVEHFHGLNDFRGTTLEPTGCPDGKGVSPRRSRALRRRV